MLTSSILTVSCKNEHKDAKEETNEMAKDSLAPVSDEVMESAVIYEVNIRQYSPEGTFNAFTKDIPQLKDLGVKVVWLMPMYPIAMKNRKATGEKSIEDITDTIERKNTWEAIIPFQITPLLIQILELWKTSINWWKLHTKMVCM